VLIDCDVVQADGGTRTGSITRRDYRVVDALRHVKKQGLMNMFPVLDYLAAVSVGSSTASPCLTLYIEDSGPRWT